MLRRRGAPSTHQQECPPTLCLRCLPTHLHPHPQTPTRSLWFTPRLEAEDGSHQERSAAERAQQLADVALAVYEAGGEPVGWGAACLCFGF